jgi:superfamily II DNA/RNA helicase
MGFIPDIERICKLVPFTRQTLFFSATMAPEITRLTETFLHNPVRIEVARASSTAVTITQKLVASAPGPSKRATLRRLIRSADSFKNAIIFCNRKRDVAILHKSLMKHDFRAGALHGDMDQRARMASLEAFKSGEVDLLVCSDVAARGLDIPDVSHVFNFDVPIHAEDYVHRIGRTGRAGKKGTALSIVCRSDQKFVQEIEKIIARSIEWLDGVDIDHLVVADDEAEETPRKRAHSDDLMPPRLPRGRQGSRSGEGSRSSEGRHQANAQRQDRTERPRASGRHDAGGRHEHARRRPSRFDDMADDAPVVGMGDHTPMFLLRPVRLKPAKLEEAE